LKVPDFKPFLFSTRVASLVMIWRYAQGVKNVAVPTNTWLHCKLTNACTTGERISYASTVTNDFRISTHFNDIEVHFGLLNDILKDLESGFERICFKVELMTDAFNTPGHP
jgi:hypothetical protein